MEREIRYCTTEDGVRIAYSVEGEGPALVVCPQFIESFSLFELNDQFRGIGRGRRFIRYDMRGTGLSQREVGEMGHQQLVEDLSAVVRALELEEFALWAAGLGGPRAIEYAARHPDQVTALVLFSTFARATDLIPQESIDALARLAQADWRTAAQTFADLQARRDSEASLVAGEIFRRSANGDVTARLLLDGFRTTDVTALLAGIRTRTLVLQRMEAQVYRFELGQQVAAGIPGAVFVPLPGRYSVVTRDAGEAISRFLDEDSATRAVEAVTPGRPIVRGLGFRTVLFTDLVGHTEMMQRLGDARGRDVLREHERITRETLQQHGGAEVKTMGDGFMASFGSVTAAMECAIALQRAFAAHTEAMPEPLHVRVGLNAGEPIEEDGDLFGATVILASRIAAKAAGGEILVPDSVRGLLSGKGFLFADRGEFLPKGFEDAVRLYEVRWQEDA